MSDHLPESSLASILAEQGVHHQEGLCRSGVGWKWSPRHLVKLVTNKFSLSLSYQLESPSHCCYYGAQ